MDVASVAVQQAILQQQLSVAMVKQSAKTEQAIVNMIAAAAAGGRGSVLDVAA